MSSVRSAKKNPQTRTPACRLHKPSGRAVVTLNGRDVYLGRYGSKAARVEYDRVIAEWLASGRRLPDEDDAQALTISELINLYRKHVERYYILPDGTATKEQTGIALAMRMLRERFGSVAVSSFGIRALKQYRLSLIERGFARTYVNDNVGRVKRLFRWAIEEEVCRPDAALLMLKGLREGEYGVHESDPVTDVAISKVEAVKPYLSRQVRAMVELQLLTAARPGEICQMRGADLNTDKAVWQYRPQTHKNKRRGKKRVIFLGKRAQAVVSEFLKPDLNAYLFSPADAVAEWQAAKRLARKSKVQPSQRDRRRRRPQRRPGERFTVSSYYRAIQRACEQAFEMPAEYQEPCGKARTPDKLTPEAKAWRKGKRSEWRKAHCWHPHQLRHTAATYIEGKFGKEAAQAALGHSSLRATDIYTHARDERAARIAAEVG